MVSQTTKGFILGFLTCSMMIVLYSVQGMMLNRTERPLNDKAAVVTQHPTNPATKQPTSRTFPTASSIATPIYRPRVLCWVMTSPENLHKRAIHVRNTWARRCDKTLFFSSRADPTFPCIGLNITEGRRHFWAKTKGAFLHIYENYRDQFDWFMKADDDTYVIVENLRHFLSTKNPNEAVYYGHQFRDSDYPYSGYNSGGSGYVLSRQALLTFGTNASWFIQACPRDGLDEDLRMGVCLNRLGVKTLNAADGDGLITFFCFDTDWHISGDYPGWYKARGVHATQKGIGNFSRNAISFHYVKPWSMYLYDYFVYRFSLRKEYGDSYKYILQGNNWIEAPKTTWPP